MKNPMRIIVVLFISLLLISCKNISNLKIHSENKSLKKGTIDSVQRNTTTYEIKIYNDFIDQVYRIYYCHLDMDRPEEYRSYHEKMTDKEYQEYKIKFDEWFRRFNEMLDTSRIIAFIYDSLYKFESPKYILAKLDSTQRRMFSELLNDTIPVPSAAFILDSLKSKKIFFERRRNVYVDWDKMPKDSAIKYFDQNSAYWDSHVSHQIGNRYYIGALEMSRVKLNRDSTLCLLECGYLGGHKCGYGHYYFLKKTNGKWFVINRIMSWIS